MKLLLVFPVFVVFCRGLVFGGVVDVYQGQRDEVVANLDYGATVSYDIIDEFVAVRSIFAQIHTGKFTPEMFAYGVEDLDENIESIASQLNCRNESGYIFGGWDGSQPAFSFERIDGRITDISYTGAVEDYHVTISEEGESVPLFLRGDEVFGFGDGTTFDSLIAARDLMLAADQELLDQSISGIMSLVLESQISILDKYTDIHLQKIYVQSIPELCSFLLFGFGCVLLRGWR